MDIPSTTLNMDPARHPVGEDGEEWEWCTWAQNWDRVMRPLILSDVHAATTTAAVGI